MTNYKKIIISISLFFFIITGTGFANIKSAKAQWVTFDLVGQAQWLGSRILDALNFAALRSVYSLTDYTAEYMAQQAAFGVLNKILEGETGGKPLFETKTASEIFEDAASSAAGSFIGDLSENLNQAGFENLNLCDPTSSVKLSLTLGLLDVEKPPPPKCDFKKVVQNWRKFGEDLQDKGLAQVLEVSFVKKKLDLDSYDTQAEVTKAYDEYFDNLFSIKKNELGAFLSLQDHMQIAVRKEKEVALAEFAKCEGFKDKKTPITQRKQTDCNLIAKELAKAGDIGSDRTKKYTDTDFASQSLTWKSVPLALGNAIANASVSFAMTIAGQLAKFYIEKGIFGLHQYEDDDSFSNLINQLRGGFDFSRPPRDYDVAREVKTPDFQQAPDYSLLTDYVSCPSEEDMRRADHCVLDNNFLSLITKKKTIRELIDEGSLDANIPFIGPDNPTHQSYDCYKNGFCYKNLVKLRKAGVVSIGWELAALRTSGSNPALLVEILECFEDSDSNNPNHNCNFGITEGEEHNPFYHLVDEDWVLKEPLAMCQHLAYSNELQSSISSKRVQYCADFKTCLEEDDQGGCKTSYGYCTRSENKWRFDGQSCDSFFSGCLTFDSEVYGKESYIEKTLDYCTADSIGCARYAQEKEDDSWILEDVFADDNDLFLNANADSCSNQYDGCSEFIIMPPAIGENYGPNLISNGNFNLDSDENLVPDGWSANGIQYANGIIMNGYPGDGGFSGSEYVSKDVPLLPNTIYSLSATAAQMYDGLTTNARIIINACDDSTCGDSSIARGVEGVGDCFLGIGGHPQDIDLLFMPSGGEMERGVCTFKTNEYTRGGSVSVMVNGGDGRLYFDEIQLRVISSVNGDTGIDFSSYGEGGKLYLSGQTAECSIEEVGCLGYIPTNDESMIPAIINQDDLCPTECVDYESFAQMPSIFDELENTYEVEYYNFIPGTGDSCPAQYINCEEFTNLCSQENSGEEIEHYSFLRQCVYEELGQTYYTWESSDVAGYQIQTWLALESNLDSAPCTNINAGGDTCQDTNDNIAICGEDTPDNLFDDSEYNPNCREFWDLDGNPHWRLQDKLIFATNDCYDYRRDSSGQLYKAISSLSTSCPSQFSNCKAYKGNFANNLRSVFKDNFESGTYDLWSSNNGSLDISNESLSSNGQSLKLSTGNHTFFRSIEDTLQMNKNFELSWWMKNPSLIDNLQFELVDANGDDLIFLGELPINSTEDILASNWQNYKITFFNEDFNEMDYSSLQNNALLKFTVIGSGNIYIDNFELKETIGNISVVKNSWQTPISCDLPYTGYHLGCRSYNDTNNNPYNLKAFNQLCREDAVGCAGAINTQNSDNPFSESYNSLDPVSEVIISGDAVEYLVPSMNNYCPKAYKGCTSLGLPTMDLAADEINGYQTVSLINDPEKYSNILCMHDSLYCDEFINSKAQSYYFKYPGERVCEYKSDIVVGDQLISGWFKVNTEEECPDDTWVNLCPAEQNLCTEFRDPTNPENCDPDVDGDCDVTEEGDYKSYYYFNNDELDKTSCQGLVDKNSGCALFYNVNNWNYDHSNIISLYDAEQTYGNNRVTDGPVSPVACDDEEDTCKLDSNELLKVTKDRNCSEWLSCKSVTQVTDQNGQIKNICDSVGICSEYNYESTDTFRACAKWSEYTNLDIDILDYVSPLTTESYQNRITGDYLSWDDDDYLGYSVPGMFPVESLVVYNFGDEQPPRLVVNGGYTDTCADADDGANCNITEDDYLFHGECAEDICWVNPKINYDSKIYHSISTRGYSVDDAPFPSSIINDTTNEVNTNYQNAEVCDSDVSSGCETIFKKVSYGLNYSTFKSANEQIESRICTDGDTTRIGDTCSTDEYCKGDDAMTAVMFGTCSGRSKIETYYNWPGICVEYDESPIGGNVVVDDDRISNLCTQWYPAESIVGTDSLYDNYQEAGYYNPSDLHFCAVSEPFALPENRLYCARFDGSNCNLLFYVPIGTKINVNKMGELSDLFNSWLVSGYSYYTSGPEKEAVNAPIIVPSSAGEGVKLTRVQFADIAGDDHRSDLLSLFDATGPNGEIRYFYYDEGVNTAGASQGGQIVYSSEYVRHFGDPCWDGLCNAEACSISASGGDRAGYHYVKHSCSNGGWCSWSDLQDDCYTYWNPLDYNYYVQSVGCAAETITVCSETECNGPSKGVQCLRGKARYSFVNASSTLVHADKDAVNCIEALDSDGNNSVGNNWCSDYSSCYPYLFTDADGDGFLDGNADGPTESVLVSGELLQEALGQDPLGCLNGTVETNCVEEGSGGGGGYTLTNSGTACSDLTCYQQCKGIILLPFDGGAHDDTTKTVVRTDIWWRSENNPTTLHIDSWQGYYYHASSKTYTSDTLTYYSRVGGEDTNNDAFGSTYWDNSKPMITQAPINTVYDNSYSSSPMFFGTNITSAKSNLRYLFNRIYYLTWNGGDYVYQSGDSGGQLGGNLGSINTYAGTEYEPYIYKVNCGGDNVCNAIDQGLTVEFDTAGNAAVKFYYYAYPDFMPIKYVGIDWYGTGNYAGTYGKYKNKLPECNSNWVMPHSSCSDTQEPFDQCDEDHSSISHSMQGFGGTADACSEGYKVFQYNYIYDDEYACNGVGGRPDIAETACYKPKVLVCDWWDNCTETSYDNWITVD